MHFLKTGLMNNLSPLLLVVKKFSAKIKLWKTFPPTNFKSPKVQQKLKWFISVLCVEQFKLSKTKHTIVE
jgi:hypothetical protein